MTDTDFDTDIANYNQEGPQVNPDNIGTIPSLGNGTPYNPNGLGPNQSSNGYGVEGGTSLAYDQQQAAQQSGASTTPLSQDQKKAIFTNATNTQKAIGGAFNTPISNPSAPVGGVNAYDAIFGHSSNPTPSQSMSSFQSPSFTPPQTIQPAASGGAGVAPVAMANTQLNAPNYQLTSDIRAKTKIKKITQKDIQAFYASFSRSEK